VLGSARFPKESSELGNVLLETNASRWKTPHGRTSRTRFRSSSEKLPRMEGARSSPSRPPEDSRENLLAANSTWRCPGKAPAEETPKGDFSRRTSPLQNHPDGSWVETRYGKLQNGAAPRLLPKEGFRRWVRLRLDRLLHVNEGPDRIHRTRHGHGVTTATVS